MSRLLHVENDPLVARAVKRLLTSRGHEVHTVYSFEEGSQLEGSFDLAIMDIDLGDGDGVELSKALLSRQTVRQVLFFTARTDADTVSRASLLGSVVGKTAGGEHLVNAVETHVSESTSTSLTRSLAHEDGDVSESPETRSA